MPSEPILRRRVSERVLRNVNCAEGLGHGRTDAAGAWTRRSGAHADSLRVSDTVVKQPSE